MKLALIIEVFIIICISILLVFFFVPMNIQGDDIFAINEPGFFPSLLIIVISISIIYEIISNSINPNKLRKNSNINFYYSFYIFIFIVVIHGFILFEIIGFSRSTLLSLFALLWFGGERRWWVLFMFTFGVTGFLLLLLNKMLGIPFIFL